MRPRLFQSGATSILHDSELETDVGRCVNRGCYSREINYEASKRQIAVLLELSAECHQSIKVYRFISYTNRQLKYKSFLIFLTVQMRQRTIEFKRNPLFLVERHERSRPVFLVGQQFQLPTTHLPVRN